VTNDEKTELLATQLMGWQRVAWRDFLGHYPPADYWEIDGHPRYLVTGIDYNVPPWQPFERVEHAWMVVKALVAAGWEIDLECGLDGIRVRTFKDDVGLGDDEWGWCFDENPDAGRAICEAAGRSLGLWKEGE